MRWLAIALVGMGLTLGGAGLGLQQAWQRQLSSEVGREDERLADFGWMLQELRVSLFAQELKTPVIVSVKRLQKMLETF